MESLAPNLTRYLSYYSYVDFYNLVRCLVATRCVVKNIGCDLCFSAPCCSIVFNPQLNLSMAMMVLTGDHTVLQMTYKR